MQTVAAAHGIRAAVHLAPFISAIVTLAGVKLHLDWEREAHYLEVHPNHSKKALWSGLLALECVGLEVMDEDECPQEIMPNGSIRTWLAEVPDKVALKSHWDELAPVSMEEPLAVLPA